MNKGEKIKKGNLIGKRKYLFKKIKKLTFKI